MTADRAPISAAMVALCLALCAAAHAETFAPGATYQTCFTPAQDCEAVIVDAIMAARSSVFMQAYSFTSPAIAKALRAAHGRGVDVRAIVDKSQRTARYSGASFLVNAGIPVLVDFRPAIAHSKIMLIDAGGAAPMVITGSYNFTRAANVRNAENIIVISGDQGIASAYLQNWQDRAAQSEPF